MAWAMVVLVVLMVSAAVCLSAGPVTGPAGGEGERVIRLWEGDAPGAKGSEPTDIPDLTLYLPTNGRPTGAAMVICPGGGYGHLAVHEGEGYARYLAERGITCFVLKYRLGKNGYRYREIAGDVARAIRLVRARAGEFGVDPQRIGVMGSSAGGHLASLALTQFDAGDPAAADPIDRQSSRPDLGVLCYPVISMGPQGHGGSRNNLLGPDASPELMRAASSELNVRADTPPCFVWHTFEDGGVPVMNSLMFAEALAKAKVPFDLHVYQKGGHGMGLGNRPPSTTIHPWADALVYWLSVQKFVNP